MNVVMLLSNAFTHDSRVYTEARSLIKAGHSVTVIGRDREKIHPVKDVLDEINIDRVRSVLPVNRSKIMRPFGLIFNGLNLLFTQWQMYRHALRLHKSNKFTAIHSHDLDRRCP